MKRSLILMILLVAAPAAAQQLLHDIFRDHVVLQRDQPVAVWGSGKPGETVTVSLGNATASARVESDGGWMVRLPSIPAGGSHVLEARASGGMSQSIEDVLIGDVFLCSGQSNMELQVIRALNAPSEIGASTNDRIRMFTVAKATSPAPLEEFSNAVEWEKASPETVRDWSAACYFFAREVERNRDIPVGLINSSWGGSDIRAWMGADALERVGGYDEPLALLRLYAGDPAAAQRRFGETWESWWRSRADSEPWENGADWPQAPEGLGDWKSWGIPDLANHLGMVWFRGSFSLTDEQAARGAELSLGGIDEVDQTWINGAVLGNTFGWGTPRTYRVPAGLLRAGKNEVVVNVLNTWGAGGMMGRPVLAFGDSEEVPVGTWTYQKVPPSVGYPPRAPWESVGGRTTIHNAMVAPLGALGLKGVLWYQGESNTGEAGSYRDLLESLMVQWREQFGENAGVLIVQLANYGRPPVAPAESGWAEVREAQRLAAVDDPHAGLAVTIDIGDVYDIHPSNKQELGRRLYRAARHVIYGEDVPPSGPAAVSAAIAGDSVVVKFSDVTGSLVAYGHPDPIGFELCGAGSCRYVDARIDGRKVSLSAGVGTQPIRVRYCWADSPICTLYDESRLPAAPFEMVVSGK